MDVNGCKGLIWYFLTYFSMIFSNPREHLPSSARPQFPPMANKNSQATLGVEVISKLVANNWSSSLEAS